MMALESNRKSCQQVCRWIILCNRKQILCSLLQLNHLLLLKRFSLLQLLQGIYQIVYVVSVTIHIDKFSKIHALIACLSSAKLCPFPLPFLPFLPSLTPTIPFLLLSSFLHSVNIQAAMIHLRTWITICQKVINLQTPFGPGL